MGANGCMAKDGACSVLSYMARVLSTKHGLCLEKNVPPFLFKIPQYITHQAIAYDVG